MDGLDAADRDLFRGACWHACSHDVVGGSLSRGRACGRAGYPDHARRSPVRLADHGSGHPPLVDRFHRYRRACHAANRRGGPRDFAPVARIRNFAGHGRAHFPHGLKLAKGRPDPGPTRACISLSLQRRNDMRRLRRRKGPLTKSSFLTVSSAAAIIAAAFAVSAPVRAADEATIQKWIAEFQPSTLSKDDQKQGLEWFAKAAEPFKGLEINVFSETITTHEYESQTLAKAFTELTGIKLKHDIIQEGDVVEKLQTQMQSGKNVYDGWINDSDLIGTHFRYGQTIALSDYMTGEGKDVTDPMLDVNDFIGKSFGTAPDGKLYQLPDQQFANLYWFRYDWFTNADYKAKFKAKYGYELGVPVNWSAYEDIAEFFTNDIKEINGVKVYGHMDYGKKDPSLGWRFTDAWLSMAGNGDKGIPNGKPVDEWGIRMEGCRPVRSSVERGGDTNGPAAVYSITKYLEWMKKYAPPQAQGMT